MFVCDEGLDCLPNNAGRLAAAAVFSRLHQGLEEVRVPFDRPPGAEGVEP